MPGNTKGNDPQGQAKDDPQPGSQGVPPPGSVPDPKGVGPGAATGTGAGLGAGGARHKEFKTPPPNHPPPVNAPPTQVLQLTPELFQQTVAAAVTAALAASAGQQGA